MKKENPQAKPPGNPISRQRKKPRTKEEVIQQMAKEDPEKVAALLREILQKRDK